MVMFNRDDWMGGLYVVSNEYSYPQLQQDNDDDEN